MRCDGCGKTVSDQHIRERIARLELATRFRPIHIGILFLADVPPPRMNDYFYHPAKDPAERSVESRRLLGELLLAAEIPWDPVQGDEEAALAEFQRRGYFLAYCCECPPESAEQGSTKITEEQGANEGIGEEVRRLGTTLVRRVQYSYKPKRIALLGLATGDMIPFLERAGLKDGLILDDGNPFEDGVLVGSSAQAGFRASLGARLREALAAFH
jgi:hypothetical protein